MIIQSLAIIMMVMLKKFQSRNLPQKCSGFETCSLPLLIDYNSSTCFTIIRGKCNILYNKKKKKKINPGKYPFCAIPLSHSDHTPSGCTHAISYASSPVTPVPVEVMGQNSSIFYMGTSLLALEVIPKVCGESCAS